ncbi:uncharacterized protein CANTADRAFT_26847 [Suhomyces tanzawaensis NRRL Y-17324]|uniref:Uncharacterized protein n=1 Tax=Suhomyces tanzawaensis NRRL Y-17324 TaxID=984487 RepID=A0A1E4SEA3_9ASCO|nr:uncharacterized protein CANTADRAFT_26847 [Suhomyces tanzawaensis NRRL Y-17324]ODV77796.1 hypothetical protein CANTADRAFT_26847 [Suhomyces tanzawaensis NRRL Y-17324]
MDESHNTERTSPFYIHANNSSASNFQTQSNNLASNVSSVGFNNLKKIMTNSSLGSNVSTSTLKTNPLTRLFTKNRSVTNIFQPPIQFDTSSQYNNSDEETQSTISSLDTKKPQSTSKFRLSKSRLFNNKSNNVKPELTIQTSGHHGLKVSKKILSSSLLNDNTGVTGRKNSVSSPGGTFHNLFHRNQAITQSNPDSGKLMNPNDFSTKQKTSSASRTSLSLSSNNSNSYVSDIKFALLYKFTDPDYSVEEIEAPNDHTMLLDIHRKLLMPTDQYLQNRTQKGQSQELGLGILGDSYDNEYRYHNGKNNAKFFENLLYITRPIFMPSTQKTLSNGLQHPYTGFTIEDIASIIKEYYWREPSSIVQPNKLTIEPGQHSSTPASSTQRMTKSKLKPLRTNRSSSTASITTPNELYEKFDELKIREISLDLFTFFVKCMNMLKKDFDMESGDEEELRTPSPSKVNNSSSVIKQWLILSTIWIYFNKKIRFALIGIFQPLQHLFHEISSQGLRSNIIIDVEIENTILLAFRDVIIHPFLLQHSMINESFEVWVDSNDKVNNSHPALTNSEEQTMLSSHKELLDNLIECFGEVLSNTRLHTPHADSEQSFKNQLFEKAFAWLIKLR